VKIILKYCENSINDKQYPIANTVSFEHNNVKYRRACSVYY